MMKKRAICLWFTGLPSAGKTTLSNQITNKCKEHKIRYHQLDGDKVRNTPLSRDAGFEIEDRERHLMRMAEVARILLSHNIYVLASFITPTKNIREKLRKYLKSRYVEVYVECDKETCMMRDEKGLWRDAYLGKIEFFTGYDQEYEEPENPEITVNTEQCSIGQCVEKIWEYISERE